jgi:hypothetical protein
MGEAPTAAVKVGWGVAGSRAVGDGGTSTGMEQLARVNKIKMNKNILSFILHPFNKKTGGGSRQLIVLL